MPVSGRPLIDYWLANLNLAGFKKVFVNTHWKNEVVEKYLMSTDFGLEIVLLHEPILLGTAGTIRSLNKFRDPSPILVVHADNFCNVDILKLKLFHSSHTASMSMVTFVTDNPQECGIVVCDNTDLVTQFHEKVTKPPSNQANAAIYILNQLVIDYINDNVAIKDFSTHVIPNFVFDIKAFKHSGILVDIGSFDRLKFAQSIDTKNFKNDVNLFTLRPILSPEYRKIESKLLEN